MDFRTTTYTDAAGREHHAVEVAWIEVERILGRPHEGTAADDATLVAVPVQAGAAIAESILAALLAGRLGAWRLSCDGIWVERAELRECAS